MEWTAEDNKAAINGLLDYYADVLGAYGEFVEQNLEADLPTKLKTLQTLKSLAMTIDLLLKRWSFAYRGYDGNTYQAREAAKAVVAERASRRAPEADDFDGGAEGELAALKLILRAVPELPENGHPMDVNRDPLTPTRKTSVPLSNTPVKQTKKETVAAEIFHLLEAGEQPTGAMASAMGRSERSVRRALKALISEGKVSRVKKGVYRLSRSVKWTPADNEVLINAVLAVYTALIDACKADVKAIFGNPPGISDTEKLRCVKTFNACVATLDRLMKRWSLVHQGWQTNPRLAKADAEAKAHHAEKVDVASAPLEAFFQVVGHYHRDMRELMENLPPPLKPPDDETGTWAYDATTQELFAPWGREPLSEAAARRRLMKRKSTTPAALILFA